MRFKVEDAFSEFSFKDTRLCDWEQSGDNLLLQLSGVIALAANSCNEELTDRYVDILQLQLRNAKITNMLLEGYKYYDANDVLQEEVPDKEIPVMDYPKIVKECVSNQGFLFQIEKVEQEGQINYEVSIDVEEKTYLITMQFDKAIFEWERFLNRVEN